MNFMNVSGIYYILTTYAVTVLHHYTAGYIYNTFQFISVLEQTHPSAIHVLAC